MDFISGEITQLQEAFTDLDSFLEKICDQLGLGYTTGTSNQQQTISKIKDRLEGRRSLIIIDNLETVQNGKELFNAIRLLADRDTRLLVTTRSVSGVTPRTPGVLLARLQPIQNEETAKAFLQWHISRYSSMHPDLQSLDSDLEDRENLRLIIERTSGIPLLMQLLLSDVVRFSWARLEKLPKLFGNDLLNFLYKERWDELSTLGNDGKNAIALLHYVHSQNHRSKISYESLLSWGGNIRGLESVDTLLKILQERFLIVNNDLKEGNFSIFPSLADFLDSKRV